MYTTRESSLLAAADVIRPIFLAKHDLIPSCVTVSSSYQVFAGSARENLTAQGSHHQRPVCGR